MNVLGDAVDLELGLVDVNLGVADGDDVDFALVGLFFEQGTLAHTNADVHLGAAHVVKRGAHLASFLAD